MTAKTAEASTVHEPLGKPGGPGLWHHKGLQLPAYIQHVAHHLIAQGHGESRAIEMAVGIVKNWAAGHDGHGNRVHPDVQAAAAKNIAQWEADKAKGSARRAGMADNKPYGDVTYADPKNGKYPVDTEEHARAAWAYINKAKNAAVYPLNGVTLSEVKDRIRAACKKFGIDISDGDDSGSRAEPWRPEYMRLYPLEDMHIIRSADGGDGRTVEAFAAVFDDPAEIQDFEGHYVETIDRSAFNKVIADASRARGGFPGSVKVLYNHGMTIQGTPSERFSVPIGVPVEIRAEAKGLLTRTRYSDTPLAEEILENIRSGSITSQSFTGRIVRSDPQLRRGEKYKPRGAYNDSLTTVRRTEL